MMSDFYTKISPATTNDLHDYVILFYNSAKITSGDVSHSVHVLTLKGRIETFCIENG